MADRGESARKTSEDVDEGEEPGASRSSMLISDSYEDLATILQDQCTTVDRQRVKSGTISEITGVEGEDSLSVSSRADDTSADSEGGNSNSSRNTPVKQIEGNNGKEQVSSVENHMKTSETEDEVFEGGGGSTTETKTEQQKQVPATQPKVEEEEEEEEELDYVHTGEWKRQKKHIFILSEAGKPIYSRYGNEDKLATTTGVMQALVSFVQDSNDVLRCMVAGEHRFVFLVREHLILVAVAHTGESQHQLLLQLTYVYNQVLSVLTHSQLSRIFKQRRNYDLRRLLTGAEKFFDSLLNLMDRDASFLLGAVRCLPLDSHIRDQIAYSISQHGKNIKDLVFAILVAQSQLITLVRLKKYFLHPLDLHLIFNLVAASESFKAAESWTPICLPKFDSGGYLHAHISYLDEECNCCLLLLTVDRDMFFTLSECKQKIQQRLIKYHCLKAMNDSLARTRYRIGDVAIPDLRHFLYKAKSTAQYTSPEFEAPYQSEEEQSRIHYLYYYLHGRIHNPARPLKILFHVGHSETLLGWVTSGFELYAVFGPLVTKPVAINSVNKLLKWIKREEDRLFILNSPTF